MSGIVLLITISARADDGDREIALLSTARNASVLLTVRYEFARNFLEHGGSGIIVAPDTVLTCFHVAWGNPPGAYTVIRRDGKSFLGTLVAYERKYDLALLAVEGIGGKALVVAEESPGVGQTIWVIGSPNKIPHVVTKGILSKGNVTVLNGFADVNLSDVTILPGSSGSGVYTDDGKLSGLVLGIMGMQNVSSVFTILARPEHITKFLAKRPKEDKIPVDKPLPVFNGPPPDILQHIFPEALPMPFDPIAGKTTRED